MDNPIEIPNIKLTNPSATIYRVHHHDSLFRGMYTVGPASSFMMDLDGRHPAPEDDPKLGWEYMDYRDHPRYIFGFCNLEQLKFWVYKEEWITRLKGDNFIISRLEAISPMYVFHGRTQAIIDRESILHISHIPWEVLNQ